MNFNETYLAQVDLLLEVLPVLNKFDCFALKGGTAINLFIRNMPRLSVDIDLAYLPIEPRHIFLENMTAQLTEMQKLITNLKLLVKPSYTKDKLLSKLFVYRDGIVIKIEPNFVIRGSVFDCETRELCQKAQDQFFKYSQIRTFSVADLYGGKICAALDRQHPRDLFDVKMLFDDQGFTETIRQALIVYLISSPRPIHELLNANPNFLGFEECYNKEFSGMALEPGLTCNDLIDTKRQLIQLVHSNLSDSERKFLMSFKEGNPDWRLLPMKGIDKLPAVQWKLANIRKIPNAKIDYARDKLKKILGL